MQTPGAGGGSGRGGHQQGNQRQHHEGATEGAAQRQGQQGLVDASVGGRGKAERRGRRGHAWEAFQNATVAGGWQVRPRTGATCP